MAIGISMYVTIHKRNKTMSNLKSQPYKTGQFALTSDQVEKLLMSFDSLQDKAIISLAISIGLRREDLVRVKYNDVNLPRITYYEQKKKRTRTVTIPSGEVIQTLKMYMNTMRKSEWLFPSPKTKGKFENAHISSRHVYDIFNEHLDLIGVKRRPFHSLRATCYKLLQKSGWKERQACEMLGDSLRVAQEHYDAPSDEEMNDLAINKQIF